MSEGQMTEHLTPPLLREIEEEAARCREFLDKEPPNDMTDMLYAGYTTLCWVLGYGTAPPFEAYNGQKPKQRDRHGQRMP
jgi:hypothetical protein